MHFKTILPMSHPLVQLAIITSPATSPVLPFPFNLHCLHLFIASHCTNTVYSLPLFPCSKTPLPVSPSLAYCCCSSPQLFLAFTWSACCHRSLWRLLITGCQHRFEIHIAFTCTSQDCINLFYNIVPKFCHLFL